MKWALILTWILSLVTVGYTVHQNEFWSLWVWISVGFALYALLLKRNLLTVKEIIGLGILIRILLLPSFPLLSDDIYRYLWDGLTWWCGANPYNLTPTQASLLIERPDLLSAMNSADYHALYPMIPQGIFALGASVSGGQVAIFTLFIKLVWLLCELGIVATMIRICRQMALTTSLIGLYFLNPLVIIETAANAHFEVLMLLPVLLAVMFLNTNAGYLKSGISLGAAIGAKILPAMFAPLLLIKSLSAGRNSSTKFLLGASMSAILLFLPIIYTLQSSKGFLQSADLFVSKFEFNASIYFIVRSIGTWLMGYNPIAVVGPVLSVIAGLIIIYLSWLYSKRSDWISGMVIIFGTYLLFGTTIHPWYLILPLGLSIFTKENWIICWSYLIFLSYSHYSHESPFSQVLIFIEYILVLVWYVYAKRKSVATSTTDF